MYEKKTGIGHEGLAAAIIERAIADYCVALSRLEKDSSDREAKKMKADCERFFKEDIEMYMDIDGRSVISSLQRKIKSEKQKGKGGVIPFYGQ